MRSSYKTLIKVFIYILVCFGSCYLIWKQFKDVEKDTPIDCSFIRTYEVLLITPSNDESKEYITIKEFQGEEVATVLINKPEEELLVGSSYEFTFKKRAVSLEDKIDVIFTNSDLVKVELTEREGLDQIRDDICR